MDPINPWLDPSEVRHLAEQLLRPVAPARLTAADPGFDADFIGFIKPEAAVARDQESPPSLRDTEVEEEKSEAEASPPASAPPASDRTESSQEKSPQPGAPAPLPAAPSQSRFLERIRIFRDWLAKNFSARDIFILDRDGKVIFDESGHGRLHFMARNLALASRGSGNIHVKIGPASILEVIPCETPYGRIVLGSLVPESLPPSHVQTITEVLLQTASPT
ncbi:hypothetical protein ACFSSA_10550 [Luteolibacter algae]|uniref:Roadblock/LAMTOR2 domain-containing protein n=1 Tax=Luteolibacter algae TaxID=454151 RepID=A0ABW5D9M6_9BACT